MIMLAVTGAGKASVAIHITKDFVALLGMLAALTWAVVMCEEGGYSILSFICFLLFGVVSHRHVFWQFFEDFPQIPHILRMQL